MQTQKMAMGLGWFSVGLGLTELLLPGTFGNAIGTGDAPGTCAGTRALGLRELTSGVGILRQPGSAAWLWSRVAGDVMDVALLARAFHRRDGGRGRLLFATANVLGVTFLDALTAVRLTREQGGGRPIDVAKAITINRSPQDVYRFFRDFGNLPTFMAHLESVEVHGNLSHWRAKAPLGLRVEWDAELVLDEPGRAIAWRSVEGAMIPNEGSVRFDPAAGGRGTELRVELRYEPPGGRIGSAFAKLFGEEPSEQINGDLRRFKQVMETGGVVHSDASIHHGMHAARPSSTQAVIS